MLLVGSVLMVGLGKLWCEWLVDIICCVGGVVVCVFNSLEVVIIMLVELFGDGICLVIVEGLILGSY